MSYGEMYEQVGSFETIKALPPTYENHPIALIPEIAYALYAKFQAYPTFSLHHQSMVCRG